MWARVARYEVPSEQMDEAIDGFREVGVRLQEIEGLIGGYLLIDEENGTTITVTLWENHAALAASQTRASVLRQSAVKDLGGSVTAVDEYEVALEFGGYTRDLREE